MLQLLITAAISGLGVVLLEAREQRQKKHYAEQLRKTKKELHKHRKTIKSHLDSRQATYRARVKTNTRTHQKKAAKIAAKYLKEAKATREQLEASLQDILSRMEILKKRKRSRKVSSEQLAQVQKEIILLRDLKKSLTRDLKILKEEEDSVGVSALPQLAGRPS